MNLDREEEYLKYLVLDLGKIKAGYLNYIREKAVIMEEFDGLTYPDVLLLNHILSEKDLVESYNKFNSMEFSEVTNVEVTEDLIHWYKKLNGELIPISVNESQRTMYVTGIGNLQNKVTSAKMAIPYELIPVKSFFVACLMLELKFTQRPDDLLATFIPQDKAKIICMDAIESEATDIHFDVKYNSESETFVYTVEFRIAGELEPWTRFELTREDNEKIIYHLVNKAKGGTQGSLKTVQGVEAAIEDLIGDGQWFARITASPALKGFHCVIRIHPVAKTAMPIPQLGFSEDINAKLYDISKKEKGITMITGKTGSGKNTTAYAVLGHIIKTKSINVREISNPVEALLECTQQNFTSDEDLEILVRRLKKEDPDIVFVSEIPNKRIAIGLKDAIDSNIGIITTTHIDRAWHIVHKLFDYYGEDFKNVLSQFNAVINQVMFRKLCPKCKQKVENIDKLSQREIEVLYKLETVTTYLPNKEGCSMCKNGYQKSPFPQAEILFFDDDLVNKLIGITTPIEMELFLREYMIKKKWNMEVYLKTLITKGVIDAAQIVRRGLCNY